MQILLLTLFLGLFSTLFGQSPIQNQANELQSDRLFSYDDIPFKWNLEGKLQVFLNEGINYLQEGNSEIALNTLNDFIKQDSSTWVAYYYRGVCNKRLSKFKQAEKDLLKAISFNTNSYESLLELAKVNHLKHNVKGAVKYYDKAITLSPEKPVAYFLKGELELIQGNTNGAIKNYKMSLAKDTNFSDAKTKLALIEIFKTKSPEAGLPYLDEVLQKDSLNRTALIFRSTINLKRNPKKSLSDFNKLITLNPENINIRLSRGLLMIELGEYENAFSDLRRVIQANNESENSFIGQQTNQDKKIDILNAGYYTIRNVYGLGDDESKKVKKAFCLLLVSKFQECINTLNTVTDYEKSPLCFFLKGVASEHLGDHKNGLLFYTNTIKLDNDILDPHKKLGIYMTNLEFWDKAENEFSQALRLNPNLYLINKLRGVSRYYKNDFKGAILDFSRYLEADSSDSEALLSRAQSYEKTGEFIKGSEDRLTASDFHVLSYNEIMKSISTILQVGDTTKALKYVDKFLNRNPTSTAAYVFKLSILLKRKAWDRIPKEVDLALKTVSSTIYYRGDYSFLLVIKGLVYLNANNAELAKEQFSSAIDIDKTNGQAFLERGRLLLRQQKTKPALKDLKIASNLGIKEADRLIREIK